MTKYFKTMREALHEARQFRDPKVDLKVVKNDKIQKMTLFQDPLSFDVKNHVGQILSSLDI